MDKLPTIGVFLAILLLESARLSVLRALTSWVLSFFSENLLEHPKKFELSSISAI